SISARESFSPGMSSVVISNQTVLEILQRFEHSGELAGAEILIEPLAKTLEINVGGIHVPEKFCARLRRDIAGAHGDGPQSTLAARLCHVDRIFEKNHGVVVSKGNRTAAAAHSRIGNGLRGSHILNPVEIASFGDVPVLAELAGQVAPRSAKRQDR